MPYRHVLWTLLDDYIIRLLREPQDCPRPMSAGGEQSRHYIYDPIPMAAVISGKNAKDLASDTAKPLP
jgi:hypothetical protein